MAARKKAPRRARSTKAKPTHSGESSDHGGVVITITIGPLTRIPKTKKRQKPASKEVKAFLKWALTQL
jgi:hypothetical protein